MNAPCLFHCHNPPNQAHDECFIGWIIWRHRHGYDTAIHIVGDERDGKSGFAMHIQLRILETLGLLPRWNIDDSLFYTWKQFSPILNRAFDRFESLRENLGPRFKHEIVDPRSPSFFFPFFWADEATNLFDKKDTMRTENREGNKLFRQSGYLRALTLLVDPDDELDKYFGKHRSKVRAIVAPNRRRGEVRLQLLQKDPNRANPPNYVRACGDWQYPDPAHRWPREWAEYDPRKINSMGFHLRRLTQKVTDLEESRFDRKANPPPFMVQQ